MCDVFFSFRESSCLNCFNASTKRQVLSKMQVYSSVCEWYSHSKQYGTSTEGQTTNIKGNISHAVMMKIFKKVVTQSMTIVVILMIFRKRPVCLGV